MLESISIRERFMEEIGKLLKALSPEEKAALVSGTDFMYTNPVPRLDIPSIRTSDGPHGLRVQNNSGDNGVTGSEPSTCFPTAVAIASSWNPENAYNMGKAMADEAKHYGINVILGPGANIKRNPLGGRNFEYFSEDPILSGKMAAGEIEGIEESGIGVSLKHFAANNSENYRFMGNSIVDKRSLEEIYLKSFEIAVKEGKPETLMCAYNRINGEYCCQNRFLLTDTLRTEWGFDGLVMSDWGATHDRVKMLEAGLDLEMPGDTTICRKWIMDGLKDGSLKEETLDKAVCNVLKLVAMHDGQEKKEADFAANSKLAEQIALDSAVLLKNDGTLPLSKEKRCLIVGELFEKMRYQGAGSSMINPFKLVTPKEAFDEAGINYAYIKGYKENRLEGDDSLLEEVEAQAKNFDVILAFIGLTDYVESEGADRESMSLPQNQLDLMKALCGMGKKVVAVLYGGSPFGLPFLDNVQAVLNMYLPGECGGEATRKLLYGEANPSGKLAETWPCSYEDVPYGSAFGKEEREIYKESIFVGYRYYQKVRKSVAFPFGYGLSYTKFSYSHLSMKETEKDVTLTFKVSNVGACYGGEVAQVYVSVSNSNLYREVKSLKGFKKVYLEQGETKEVEIAINKEELRYFDIKEDRFVLENAKYNFLISSSSEKVELEGSLNLTGEKMPSPYSNEINELYSTNPSKVSDADFESMSGLKIPPKHEAKPITLDSRFSDLGHTSMGKILFNAVTGFAKKDMKRAQKLPEGSEKDNKIKGALFLKRILESNSLITLSMSAGKNLPYNFAQGFVDLSNGHIFKGIKDFCGKVKAPELPKNIK